ncbi:MAG: hypothetical protein NVSMB6_06430 [Burkholderiaceae bacterium]
MRTWHCQGRRHRIKPYAVQDRRLAPPACATKYHSTQPAPETFYDRRIDRVDHSGPATGTKGN